ncbi:MAG: hypothetical protein COU72_04065 [Parcubacteria group bacterium CG10_big_fil_rev_8_21_14_0_10_41_35]|nr:MAG: hypothetical protein COU72_04065 [Parcubacteria group bacterium CG10_big_fil_rev_8_21_14_0_10_41_35]
MGMAERLYRNGWEPFDYINTSATKIPLDFMIKKILKWTIITVGCLFGVIVAVAIISEPIPKPIETATHEVVSPLSTTTAEVAVSKTTTSNHFEVKNTVSVSPQVIVTPAKPATSDPKYTYYSVIKVVDGDTLSINLEGVTETIRLIGINTPETVDPRKPVECFGKQASDKAKMLLSGKNVRIEKDVTQGDRDKYGRLLAYVWRDDGLFFNEYMIQEGYAYEYTYNKPYKYQTDFKADQTTAKAQNKGLWAPDICNGSSTTSSTEATPLTANGHTFYLSSYYSSKFYYCDTDDGWKSLSSAYLKSYTSEETLLAAYPSRTLHEPCK